MAPEPYAYQKLVADQHQIRLLHVGAATTWHEEISCELTTVSLGDNPQFEALSYVWGNAQDTLPIQLEGGVFPVTRNLEAAIRRLRMKTEKRVIWIDQLCINQADIAEKSIQLALMPRIYKSCKEVILWLGEIEAVDEITVEDALTSEANVQGVAAAGLAVVQEFASGKHVHEISCFQLINESTIITSPDYAIGLKYHF
ncbi:MAG: hypothetical protein Q9207_001586 [Kuettlingeria erythrocarpa]